MFTKKFKLKNINSFILFFICLSAFEFIYCQEKVGESNHTRNLDEVGQNQEDDYDPNSEPLKDNFGLLSCRSEPDIYNKECFNNIIMFNHKKFQVNNFAANKNGDVLIQYNEYNNYDEENSSRLFYGLRKNGSYFFSNESSFTREFNISIDEEILENSDFLNSYIKQDSKSLFVSIKNVNKKNQYLFSINSYSSTVELYDLNNNNNNYIVRSFNKFFNLDEDDYYFPFEYELFEIKDKSEYIIVFFPIYNVDEDILDVSFIKKFRFKSFDINAYEELSSINYEDYLNCIILNAFLLEESKTLVILSFNETIIDEMLYDQLVSRRVLGEGNYARLNRRIQSITNDYPPYQAVSKFNLKFYDQKLKSLLGSKEVILINHLAYSYQGINIFIKSLYLNILNKQFVIILYLIENGEDNHYYFIFNLFEINILDYISNENAIYPVKLGYVTRDNIDFNLKYSPNDFIKINDKKVVFMYLDESFGNLLSIIIINVNLDDEILNALDFGIYLDDYTPTQIKGFAYNGYLLFSATGIEENYYEYNDENSNNYLSVFIAFGYSNSTNNEIENVIDITKFLNKRAQEEKDSFIYFLYDNLKIENNIFEYIPLEQIKIVSFPKELSLYLYDYEKEEEIKLTEKSYNLGEFQQTLNPDYDSGYLIIDSYCIFKKHFTDSENFVCETDHDYIIR